MSNTDMSVFADTIMRAKYAHVKEDGTKESWEEIAERVARSVLGAVKAPEWQIIATAQLIAQRKFIPGGRYLYASGRPFHQVQNCVLTRAEDSRAGWSDHLHKASMALMTGAGLGTGYSQVRAEGTPIRRTGGTATGPLALMHMTNECGRFIMQGGSRRSAIWAGLNWAHPDIFKFIMAKDWSPEIRALKEKDFNFPAPLDGTNISVQLDDEFFAAYHNSDHPQHGYSQEVYWQTVRHMLESAEPGFSVDCGPNAGEDLRNAPVSANTSVLTDKGVQRVSEIIGEPTTVWTGRQWADNVLFKKTGDNVPVLRVWMTGGRSIVCDPTHPFIVERYLGAGDRRRLVALERVAAGKLQDGDILHVSMPEHPFEIEEPNANDYALGFLPNANDYALGFLYGDGSFRGGRADLTLCSESKRVCVEWITGHSTMTHTKGEAGEWLERVYFSDPTLSGRTKSEFPHDYRVCGRGSLWSFLAGLFDADGSYDRKQNRIRLGSIHYGFLRDVQRGLERLGIQANISRGSDSGYSGNPSWQLVVAANSVSEFARSIPTLRLKPKAHTAYRDSSVKVTMVENGGSEDVFCADVKVKEHTFMAEGVIISNCTEVTSFDDSDICNLGSINMARINSLGEMLHVVRMGTAFLLAGTVYSDIPYAEIGVTREKNRRLGLGLMGLHEWMLKRGLPYGPSEELARFMTIYATSGLVANEFADLWGLSHPIKTRAIAPTGTIGIVGETTTGIEPVFCVAFKRRYLEGKLWTYQYVIDPAAARLIASGSDPEAIEDAYTLAKQPERRIAFQAWLQQYVDHAISSTLNLPEWGSEWNNEERVKEFGDMLIRYLPQLRGITCYPDGARGGQPLTPVHYSTAMKHVGQVFYESQDICDISHGGTCGS